MDDEYIDELHSINAEHFWINAKRWYLSTFVPDTPVKIVDIGCGSGNLLSGFVNQGHCIYGIDISDRALQYCHDKGYRTFKADLSVNGSLKNFKDVADIIFACDFLEHIEFPELILKELLTISHKNTKLIITVPAHKFLYGDWDIAMSHYKRYSKTEILSELSMAGWEVKKNLYIHILPLIPAIISRLFFKGRRKKEKMEFYCPSKVINSICKCIYRIEFLCFNLGIKLPGLSILVVAKPKTDGK